MKRTKKRRRIIREEVLAEDLNLLDANSENRISNREIQENAMFRNIEMGRNNTIRFILEEKTEAKNNVTSMRDGNGRCPLMRAVEKLNLFLVRLFLIYGLHINNQYKDGNTVFHILAMKKTVVHFEDWCLIFDLLLTEGGNRFIRNKKKQLPIDLLDVKEQKNQLELFTWPKTVFEAILCHDDKRLDVILSTTSVLSTKTNNQGKCLFQILKESNLQGDRRDNTKMTEILQKYCAPMISLE